MDCIIKMEFGVSFIESTSLSMFCPFLILMSCLPGEGKKLEKKKSANGLFRSIPAILCVTEWKERNKTNLTRQEQAVEITELSSWKTMATL